MAFTFNNKCNSFALWWQNTYAQLETILVLFETIPSTLDSNEIKKYQDAVQLAIWRVRADNAPAYASAIQEDLITALCHLETSLDALTFQAELDAASYYQLAQGEWMVVRDTVAKYGNMISLS